MLVNKGAALDILENEAINDYDFRIYTKIAMNQIKNC